MAGELEDARMPDEIEPSGMYEGQEHPEDGCVYFALCPYERAVKIGYTGYDDPWQRFNHLQATTAHWLCMLGWLPSGARQLERIVHQHFKEQRLYGEWFDFSDKWLRGEVGRMLGLDGVQCDDFWRVYHDR